MAETASIARFKLLGVIFCQRSLCIAIQRNEPLPIGTARIRFRGTVPKGRSIRGEVGEKWE